MLLVQKPVAHPTVCFIESEGSEKLWERDERKLQKLQNRQN